MKKLIVLIFLMFLASAAAFAQCPAAMSTLTTSTNLSGSVDSKLCALSGAGAPTSSWCTTALIGKATYTNTSNGDFYACTANLTWTPMVSTAGSYANPAWITSLAYSKLTGVPSFITNPLVAAGDFLIGGASGVPTRLVVPGNGTFCPSWSSGAVTWITCPGAGGGLSSVGLTMPSGFTVASSPLTVNGTLAVTLGSQTGSFALIAPTGGGGVPTWRAMVKADLPATTIYSDQVNSYAAGMKQTFTSSSTTAALNFAPYAGDPSTLFDGDHWYNSSSGLFKARIASTTKTFATIDGNVATASALASTPSLCSTGFAPTGVLANGNATGCAALGGSGAVGPPYISSLFTGPDTTRTISGATHGFTNAGLIVMVYDNATPRNSVGAGWTLDPTTKDVVVNFAAAQSNYYVVINGGTGPTGPTGPSGSGGSVFTGSTASTVASSATPAFSLADVSVKSPIRFNISPVVNVTAPTITNKTAGAHFFVAVTTDGTHTWAWNSIVSDNVCSIWTATAATTVAEITVDPDGSTLHGGTCLGGPAGADYIGPTGSALPTPASGLNCWADSTDNQRECKDASGNISKQFKAGVDANPTTGQVTATHLASPLPVNQGGTGTTSPGIVAGSGIGVSGSWPNQTVALGAAQLIRPCEIAIGDPGAASSVLADDNDSPGVCGNLTGATLTISKLECTYYPTGGTAPIINASITGGGQIATANLTCGAAGTFGSTTTLTTTTQTSGQSIDANIVTAGGTAKYVVIRVTRTL